MAKNRARTQDDKSVFADNNKPRQSELFETQEEAAAAYDDKIRLAIGHPRFPADSALGTRFSGQLWFIEYLSRQPKLFGMHTKSETELVQVLDESAEAR